MPPRKGHPRHRQAIGVDYTRRTTLAAIEQFAQLRAKLAPVLHYRQGQGVADGEDYLQQAYLNLLQYLHRQGKPITQADIEAFTQRPSNDRETRERGNENTPVAEASSGGSGKPFDNSTVQEVSEERALVARAARNALISVIRKERQFRDGQVFPLPERGIGWDALVSLPEHSENYNAVFQQAQAAELDECFLTLLAEAKQLAGEAQVERLDAIGPDADLEQLVDHVDELLYENHHDVGAEIRHGLRLSPGTFHQRRSRLRKAWRLAQQRVNGQQVP